MAAGVSAVELHCRGGQVYLPQAADEAAGREEPGRGQLQAGCLPGYSAVGAAAGGDV